MKKGLVWILVGLVILILPAALLSGYQTIGPNYQWNYEVHSHILNAYYANSPELMISELNSCEEGMRNLGLTAELYGAWLPWEQTPDIRMDYQYNHIDAIINRTKAVIEWRNQTYTKNGTAPETLGDVYNEKMDNLRGFLVEDGWSDWISYRAFFVHGYLWLVIWNDIVSWGVYLVGFIILLVGLVSLKKGFSGFRKKGSP
ncbi:MAG TPA: hypothetical protein HA260_00720 [Thermoplasmata archaeon]|nr:hypothetical protein [Thermoplasmata archaeon]